MSRSACMCPCMCVHYCRAPSFCFRPPPRDFRETSRRGLVFFVCFWFESDTVRDDLGRLVMSRSAAVR